MVACNERMPCAIWSDHRWEAHRFVENGRHPTMGRYQKFLVTCDRCGQTTTETHWLDLPIARPAFEPFGEDGRR